MQSGDEQRAQNLREEETRQDAAETRSQRRRTDVAVERVELGEAERRKLTPRELDAVEALVLLKQGWDQELKGVNLRC